jgi:hypothetical protein
VRVSGTTRELVVAVDEVPEPVIEQVAEPNAVNAPAGKVRVKETCVPETVPASVPVIIVWAVPTSPTYAPVALLPLCVAVQVTGIGGVLPWVPLHVPAKLRTEEGAVLLLHPDAKSAAQDTASAEIWNLVRNVIGLLLDPAFSM